MPGRDFDILVYGASGFVGRQIVPYLGARAGSIPLRIAIAGRDAQKLEKVRAASPDAIAAVFVASADDTVAIDAVVARTRVVINTAGPFALFGNAVVDACVRFGTHYVDITGETPWIADLIERYDERAKSDRTRIVPACGFDSVPSDIGAFFVSRFIQNELGVPCAQVRAYFRLHGGINGGTIATLLLACENPETFARTADPFLLTPAAQRGDANLHRDPERARYDTDIGAWTGPFVMGPINTRVVRRSAALYATWKEPYGPHFSYQEYLKFGKRFTASAVTGIMCALQASLRQPALRGMLKPLLPKPGSGPSEKTMSEAWFKCELLGFAEDGRMFRAVIRDKGDPANGVTVKCVCESALGLLLDADALPGAGIQGGIMTPATALGDVLVRRLREAGMTIEASQTGARNAP
jgi:short subunit dehydrogenase-like uncharacterized protein